MKQVHQKENQSCASVSSNEVRCRIISVLDETTLWKSCDYYNQKVREHADTAPDKDRESSFSEVPLNQEEANQPEQPRHGELPRSRL